MTEPMRRCEMRRRTVVEDGVGAGVSAGVDSAGTGFSRIVCATIE